MLQVLKSPAAIIRAAFFVQSLCIGGFFSRLAEIQLNMGASTAELGIGLLGVDVGAFLSLPFAARAIERIGNRNTLLYGTPFFALTVALTSLAPNYIVFFFLAMFVAVGFTFTAIAMNVEADRIEFATGRRIMNSSHGMWSLGFFISSLIGTAIVALGTWPALHLLAAVPVKAEGEYCFELTAGDVLFGDLFALDEEEAEIEAAGLGRLHVRRNQILRMHRRGKESGTIYLGPRGLSEWRISAAAAPKTPIPMNQNPGGAFGGRVEIE
ncbi:MAG: hypothetical protein WD230_09250, partial [Cucumibacter sp.]